MALLLRRANADEQPDAREGAGAAEEEVLREGRRELTPARRVCLVAGHLGTGRRGARHPAARAPRREKPITLSVGGPMGEVVKEKDRLLKVLAAAVADRH